ncbi:MAG: RpiB/LacA/LacB family sugar-phosphate isomerase, partial [FCB group bacterium]|nr:RpiB/LacA/LacB family sugar-phosphate isomerase [FCB group bacterium]
MKIAIGSDHAGFELKKKVKAILEVLGHEINDFGTDSTESVDYPDFGLKVANAVASGDVDRGVTI